MRKGLLVLVVLALCFNGCGSKKGIKLEKGTPLYDLAKEIAKKYPAMDPDVNKDLVSCKYFTLTPGTFFTELQRGMGKNTDQLKTLDEKRLQDFFKANVERLGERQLFLETAKAEGIKITPAELDSTLLKIYTQNGGQEAFAKRIGDQGITLDVVRQDVEREMTLRKYFDKKNSEIKVAAEELENIYNQDKTASVRHILLTTRGLSDSAKAVKRTMMQGLLDRAKAGEDFAALAKQYTEDPGSKNNGGLYENFPRGQMVKPFEDAAFTVPVGQLSDIVETDYGYHILQIVDRKKETRPLADVKAELEQQLLREKRRNMTQTLLETLKKEADYKISI
ncbi:MAG TPA: peptidylprolyl isomerase [bacterium]|nr:peptidylprolyl isomerase [bacterium]HPN35129.1 peptidylprolyl isomerase [bacterium]